jgi:hypothetical protein
MGTPSKDVADRREIVRHMLQVEGLTPLEIAEKMFRDGTIEADSIRKAHRIVRADAEFIRNEMTGGDAAAAAARERQLFILRMERVLGQASREMDKTEGVTVSKTTFDDGRTMTTMKKADRAGVRQRWAEKYIQASRFIAQASGVDIKTGPAEGAEPGATGKGDPKRKAFVWNVSGKSVDTLIGERAGGKGVVN